MMFTTLVHLIDVDFLREAYRLTRKDKSAGEPVLLPGQFVMFNRLLYSSPQGPGPRGMEELSPVDRRLECFQGLCNTQIDLLFNLS